MGCRRHLQGVRCLWPAGQKHESKVRPGPVLPLCSAQGTLVPLRKRPGLGWDVQIHNPSAARLLCILSSYSVTLITVLGWMVPKAPTTKTSHPCAPEALAVMLRVDCRSTVLHHLCLADVGPWWTVGQMREGAIREALEEIP